MMRAARSPIASTRSTRVTTRSHRAGTTVAKQRSHTASHDYGGRYVDRLEKRESEWKISHRQVVMDWNHNEISSGIFDEGMFKTLTLRGTRGHMDPVFKNIIG